MYRSANVTYTYDGSFDGALCCVFEAFVRKERPADICPEENLQPTLRQVIYVPTDAAKAERVAVVLTPKISRRAEVVVQHLFWSCHPEKELLMLDFIRLGLETGSRVTSMLGNEIVARAADAVKHLQKEAHNFKGFLRFSDYSGMLVGIIEPKNYVLPLLSPHFCARYRDESFLIWDKTHRMALAYVKGEERIFPLKEFTPPPADATELQTRELFRRFFDTIAISERENPRCQMTHLPKRYRGQMTEFTPAEGTCRLGQGKPDRPHLPMPNRMVQ